MKREYITYSISEFFLLGRKDALTDGKKETTKIFNELKNIMSLSETKKRLISYLQGYKIGTLEALFNNIQHTTYDNETNEFIHYEENQEIKTSFEKGYDSLIEESELEVLELIKRSAKC